MYRSGFEVFENSIMYAKAEIIAEDKNIFTNLNIPYFMTKNPFNKAASPNAKAKPPKIKGNSSII